MHAVPVLSTRDLLAAHPGHDGCQHQPSSSGFMVLDVLCALAPFSHLYCRALCWTWVWFRLSVPSFYSWLARQDHFLLHFLFVLNEQLLFFLPYSGNHRIPYPEAEWQDDGDWVHLSHVCSACGASPAYALLYRGKVQRFPGASRVSWEAGFHCTGGLGVSSWCGCKEACHSSLELRARGVIFWHCSSM